MSMQTCASLTHHAAALGCNPATHQISTFAAALTRRICQNQGAVGKHLNGSALQCICLDHWHTEQAMFTGPWHDICMHPQPLTLPDQHACCCCVSDDAFASKV